MKERFLIDTGSQVTLLDWSTFCSLNTKKKLQPCPFPLTGVTGKDIEIKGIVPLQFTLNGRAVVHETVVVAGIGKKCIIGADFVNDHKIIIDPVNKKLRMCKNFANDVYASETCTVESNTARTLKLRLTCPDGEYMLQPSHDSIMPGLISVTKGRALCEVFSTNMFEQVNFQRDEKIGTVLVGHTVVSRQVSAVSSTPKNISTNIKTSITASDVNLTDIPDALHDSYLKLLNRYSTIFSLNPDDIGHCTVLPQKILLKDDTKVNNVPPYRTPFHLQSVVQDYVLKLLKSNIIEHSKSPFSSPLMLVKKASANPSSPLVEQYRIVHDYRQLNENTIKDSYPLHNLYDLLDKVSQAKIWSVIDLSSGFWNQSLEKSSRQFTAFGVPGLGHFQYTRSAQGLCNSPAAFQRLLDFITKGIPGVSVYIDDVIIYSNSHDEHLQTLAALFSRLKEYNIKCRLKKIQLGAGKISYLGYDLSRDKGIQAGKAKINAVQNWTEPTNVKEVRQFLGLCSFFRRTIPNFAQISQPLTSLTRKDSKWLEGRLPSEAANSFQILKTQLCSRPCLRPVNFNEEFILSVDASKIGLGAVLSQLDPKTGVEYPCAYASRTLNDAEKKYAPFHLEHLAMLWGCKHFKAYLVGKHFRIRTDHKPLVALNKTQGATLERLLAELENFLPFTIEYLKGETMPADGLSRIKEVAARVASEVSGRVNVNWFMIKTLQSADPKLGALQSFLKSGAAPKAKDLFEFVKIYAKRCKLQDGVLTIGSQIFCPTSLRDTILRLGHDNHTAGHFGIDRTTARIQKDWYWPNMRSEIEWHVKACVTCNSSNPLTRLNSIPLEPLPVVSGFNDRVHVDLLGPLNSSDGNSYVLLMIDAFSKLVSTCAIPNKQKNTVATAFFESWICRHGVCRSLVSDRGTEFTNDIFKHLQQEYDILHINTSANHPQSNGLAERQMRNILTYLRKFLENKQFQWHTLLPSFDFAYNTTIHESHRKTPFFAAFSRNPILPSTIINPKAKVYTGPDATKSRLEEMLQTRSEILSAEHKAFLEQKDRFDRRTARKIYKQGDHVFIIRNKKGTLQQKLQQPFQGPYLIVKVNEHTLVLNDVKSATKKKIFVHKNNVKPASFITQIFDHPVDTPEAVESPQAPVLEGDDFFPFECESDRPTHNRPEESLENAFDGGSQREESLENALDDASLAHSPTLASGTETSQSRSRSVHTPPRQGAQASSRQSPLQRITRTALDKLGIVLPDKTREYLPLRRRKPK